MLSAFSRLVNAQEAVSADILLTEVVERGQRVLLQADILTRHYAVVVANPPYMGASRMSASLSSYLQAHFRYGRAGLDVAFWLRVMQLVERGGLAGLITMQSWMFLATYADFRSHLFTRWTIQNALHLGSGAFPEISGEVVAAVAAVMSATTNPATKATYVQLTARGIDKEATARRAITEPDHELAFQVSLADLAAVPRLPIAYWMGPGERSAFAQAKPIAEVARMGNGLTSANNDRFLRTWWEVSINEIEFNQRHGAPHSSRRWHPLNKAGGFRRWYGNRDYVIDWGKGGQDLLNMRPASTVRNPELYFRESVSWSDIVTGRISFRYYPEGTIFDASANSIFPTGEDVEGLLAFGNSAFTGAMAPLLNPGIHFKLGDMGALPYLKRSDPGWRAEIRELVSIATADWNTLETSRDFRAPVIMQSHKNDGTVSAASRVAARRGREVTLQLQALEHKNNRQIAEQYDLGGTYAFPPALEDVSLNQNPWRLAAGPDDGAMSRAHSSDLVSYAVGCMFGRYSVDEPGLIIANQGGTVQDYLSRVQTPAFMPDADNVIPVLDGEWFEDDIVAKFRQFLRVTFGEEHFEENLNFVVDSLGVKDLRDYFVKSFYKDHVQRYKKRPIYWLFSSPKGSFNALIYLHRYNPSTVSTVLNEYLREYIKKLEVSLEQQQYIVTSGASAREVAAAQREADRLRKVLIELADYERDLFALASRQIPLDLDDGVLVNYQKFGTALKDIGLKKTGNDE